MAALDGSALPLSGDAGERRALGLPDVLRPCAVPVVIDSPRRFPISPLEDQALSGAIMWVFGAFVYLIPAVVVALQMLSPDHLARPLGQASAGDERVRGFGVKSSSSGSGAQRKRERGGGREHAPSRVLLLQLGFPRGVFGREGVGQGSDSGR